MSEAPERIWIEAGDECPYFYDESELLDAAPPLIEYRRADLARPPDVDKSGKHGSCGNHCEACARRDDEIASLRRQRDLLLDRKGLPEKLVARLRTAIEFDLQEQFGGDLVKRLIEDVLAWHEH